MQVDLITLLPGIFDNVFNESVLGSAVRSGLIEINIHNFRDFGDGRHKTVDDTAFGGGPGMVLKPGPLINCFQKVRNSGVVAPVIGLTPQGVQFNQDVARSLAEFDRLILVCGRYEGFDERIVSEFDLQLSIGDYVLTGGEIAAMTVVDAISRMIPGTVGRQESVEQDSFYQGLLDHPQFTRPANWQGKSVPGLLLEGNHALIESWRRKKSLLSTAVNRPDVFGTAELTQEDRDLLQDLLKSSSES
ncbi:MAG: tRNA (guanosine(37)-N1)-methyltransferase TrmD [Candidatus Rifleibacteriota bacterium]